MRPIRMVGAWKFAFHLISNFSPRKLARVKRSVEWDLLCLRLRTEGRLNDGFLRLGRQGQRVPIICVCESLGSN